MSDEKMSFIKTMSRELLEHSYRNALETIGRQNASIMRINKQWGRTIAERNFLKQWIDTAVGEFSQKTLDRLAEFETGGKGDAEDKHQVQAMRG